MTEWIVDRVVVVVVVEKGDKVVDVVLGGQ
jgi:hypothetical protein